MTILIIITLIWDTRWSPKPKFYHSISLSLYICICNIYIYIYKDREREREREREEHMCEELCRGTSRIEMQLPSSAGSMALLS